MSNKYQQAADDAKRLLSGFSAVATLAVAFEEVGSLQQAQAEAESALAALKPQIEEGKAQVEQAEKTMRAAEREALVIVSNANSKADEIILEAQSKADLVRSDAEAAAEQVKQESVANIVAADEYVALAQVKRDAIYAECEALEIRANEARAYLAKLQG